MVADFPNAEAQLWRGLGDDYQKNKFYCRDIDKMPVQLRLLIEDLSSTKFLSFLESVTGIEKLIPDPYLDGGGLHLSTSGGILAPHTDFHVYERLDLYRRINLILYLNERWNEGDGGSLELWDSRDSTRSNGVRIDPIPGRVLIFQTDDRSVHGFTEPIANGCERRSLTLYYYTATDSSIFSGDYTTHWHFGGIGGMWWKIRTKTYKALMQISRGFSLLAHLVNPRQGLGWWKVRKKHRNTE